MVPTLPGGAMRDDEIRLVQVGKRVFQVLEPTVRVDQDEIEARFAVQTVVRHQPGRGGLADAPLLGGGHAFGGVAGSGRESALDLQEHDGPAGMAGHQVQFPAAASPSAGEQLPP